MDIEIDPVSSGKHRHVVTATANGCVYCACEVVLLKVMRDWLLEIGDRTPKQTAAALDKLINEREHLI